jgi:hypothetical protein
MIRSTYSVLKCAPKVFTLDDVDKRLVACGLKLVNAEECPPYPDSESGNTESACSGVDDQTASGITSNGGTNGAKSINSGDANNTSDETIGVLYNMSYGGYAISAGALMEYAQQTGMDEKATESFVLSQGRGISRIDPIMVKVVEQIGGVAASHHDSQIGIFRVAKKYENYLKISEYDGSESPGVDLRMYLLDKLKHVLYKEGVSCEEKVEAMTKLFKDEPYGDDDEACEY